MYFWKYNSPIITGISTNTTLIKLKLLNLPFTVMKCFGSVRFDESGTKATWAVICCEFEWLGDDESVFAGNIADTAIGASSAESAWSIGTTPIIDTPSDDVPVWIINFFYNKLQNGS